MRVGQTSFGRITASALGGIVPVKEAHLKETRTSDYERNGDSSESPIANVPSYELEGLTLYEKKCVLINHEIDSNGMGRYQWYIWGLCGFGYWLDLMWAQAFGLVLSPLQQELDFPGELLRWHEKGRRW